jgi:DNA polymerase III epsilon subunit-like protein
MSYCDKSDIIKLCGKKVLFIDVETIGLPKQKSGIQKPENVFYDYRDNSKYDTSRMVQLSYYYYECYNNKIPELDKIKDYIIKPKNFNVLCSEIHGITDEIANEKGIRIKKAIKEIKNLLLNDEIDYILGYNVFFDVNILMNEFHRIKKNKVLKKMNKLISDKKIIDVAQICVQLDIINKPRRKYRIFKQCEIYKALLDKEQENLHNSKYDVLNLIEITNKTYEMVCKSYERSNITEIINIFHGDNGFPINGNKDDKIYGKPMKIIEEYYCVVCNRLYVIISSSGKSSDGEYDNSIGKRYKCTKCLRKIKRQKIS